MTGELAAGQWRVELRPVNPILGRVLDSILVTGGEYLSRIEILEQSDTRTVIALSAVQALDIDEQAGSN